MNGADRRPEGADTPVEAVLARNTVRRSVYVVPPLLALFWVLRGTGGLIAATAGAAVVIGNFLLAGAMLSVAIRISLAAYQATALFGFVLRLALVAMTMLLVVRFVDIDRLAFGISAVVAYMVLLVLEAVAVARGRERELDWIR